VYNDKQDSTELPQQFAYTLSYTKALPKRLPDFYQYLLAYPNAKPANVDDTYYWARVKFGLRPTLRVVQVVMMWRSPNDQVAYAIAEKQLYSSNYFETALDLSFCVRRSDDPAKPGFYLIATPVLPADCPPVASDRSEKAAIVVSSILAATAPKPRLPRKEEH
jgi:hypothetical protein